MEVLTGRVIIIGVVLYFCLCVCMCFSMGSLVIVLGSLSKGLCLESQGLCIVPVFPQGLPKDSSVILSLSLSLSHTHTHTHIWLSPHWPNCQIRVSCSPSLSLS